MEQFKGGGKVVIPIHATVAAILEKYGGNLPGEISNQKINDYLKELCNLAGINEKVSKSITRGGARVVKFVEKWELVTTHTARRRRRKFRRHSRQCFSSGFTGSNCSKTSRCF